MWEKTEISLRRKLTDISLRSEWEKGENKNSENEKKARIRIPKMRKCWDSRLNNKWEMIEISVKKTDYSQNCLKF